MRNRKKVLEAHQRSGQGTLGDSPTDGGPARAKWLRWLLWLAAIALLWLALRNLDWATLWQAIRDLQWHEIAILAVVNLGALLVMTCRWWLIVRSYGLRAAYPRLAAFRLAAFSVSYFTPGPHFGGEPLQVHLLQRELDISSTEASATVALDKSMELTANFSFLLFGLIVLLGLGLFPELPRVPLLVVALLLLSLPVLHLMAAARGRRPLAAGLKRLPPALRQMRRLEQLTLWLAETEAQIARFFSGHPLWFIAAGLASILTWVVLVVEYWLMARFLGLTLSPLEAIAALTGARVAYLLPLPAGLGTLEASQVLAVAALGYPAAAGAALALVIRVRDVLFGGLGLLIGGLSANGRNPLRRGRPPRQSSSE